MSAGGFPGVNIDVVNSPPHAARWLVLIACGGAQIMINGTDSAAIERTKDVLLRLLERTLVCSGDHTPRLWSIFSCPDAAPLPL